MNPREIPTDGFYWADRKAPETPMQALMEAAPGVEPATSSLESQHALADVIDGLLAELEPDEAEIVMLHVNGFSVRDIEEMTGISKSRIHRELPDLMAKVARLLKSNEEVMNHVRPGTDAGAGEGGGGADTTPSQPAE